MYFLKVKNNFFYINISFIRKKNFLNNYKQKFKKYLLKLNIVIYIRDFRI